jgi:hypothetical protein
VGMFDADAQKFVANLNVTLFTPCLSMSHTHRFEKLSLNSFYSLYQAGIPIDSGKTHRSCHHSCHFYCSDSSFIFLCFCGFPMLSIQKTTGQFRRGHGSKSLDSTCPYSLLTCSPLSGVR